MGTPFAVWLTGLPASGKSSIARALRERLEAAGVRAAVLESDVLRRVLTPKATYAPEERDAFYAALLWIGRLLLDHEVAVIFDATAPRRAHRDAARRALPRFLEVHVDTPLEDCRRRDPKGLYRDADRGELRHLPGPQEAYEAPERPEIRIRDLPPETAAGIIFDALRERGWG
jgi:adenylylsulfate kinase